MQTTLFSSSLNDIKDGSEVKVKKHRTTFTQRLSYKDLNESGHRITEAIKVLELLRKCRPMTSRQIAFALEVERTNVTRSLNDLLHAGKIKIAFLDKCVTTGKTVQHYVACDCVNVKITTNG